MLADLDWLANAAHRLSIPEFLESTSFQRFVDNARQLRRCDRNGPGPRSGTPSCLATRKSATATAGPDAGSVRSERAHGRGLDPRRWRVRTAPRSRPPVQDRPGGSPRGRATTAPARSGSRRDGSRCGETRAPGSQSRHGTRPCLPRPPAGRRGPRARCGVWTGVHDPQGGKPSERRGDLGDQAVGEVVARGGAGWIGEGCDGDRKRVRGGGRLRNRSRPAGLRVGVGPASNSATLAATLFHPVAAGSPCQPARSTHWTWSKGIDGPGLAQTFFDDIGIGAMRRYRVIKPHVVAKVAQDRGDLLRLPGGRARVRNEDVRHGRTLPQ